MKVTKTILYSALSFLLVLFVWQVLVWTLRINPGLLPAPLDVAKALIGLAEGGILAGSIGISLYRFAVGYLVAVVLGVAGGLLLGWYQIVFRICNPIIQLIRPIAPVAWMPFIVLLLGIGDIPAIFIIFLAGYFPVLLATASAVHHINPIYLKVAGNFGVPQRKVLTHIVFPAVFPQIASSFHIALGTSWIFLVSGEMVGAQSGLGYLIIDSRNNLRTDELLAVMLVIGLIGFLLDVLIGVFEKKVRRVWGEVK